MSRPSPFEIGRARAAWWGIIAVLGAVLVGFIVSFIGTFVLGVFIYYGVRPLHRWLGMRIDRRGLLASLTLLLVVLPVLGLLIYTGLIAIQEFATVAGPGLTTVILARLPGDPQSLEAVLRSPGDSLTGTVNLSRLRRFALTGLGAVGNAANALFHMTLALTFAFFLMRDGPRLATWFRSDIAEPGGVADAYLTAVDADLETVYFGSVLTVLMVGAAALLVYHGFNFLSPAVLRVPFPTLLALLTGLATFVPLVVGKLVYLPTAGYLAWTAIRTDPGLEPLAWVGAFLVVAFVVLDLMPQTVVRPYISGQSLHSGLVLFAYVLGAALFGWYGLFLGPLLAVLVVQAANVVLPELLSGERLTPSSHLAIGSAPWDQKPPHAHPDDPGELPTDNADASREESVDE